MGLDITAWERAELTEPHDRDVDGCDASHVLAFAYAGFEQSLRGLAEAGISASDEKGWEKKPRCYAVSGETLEFRAGSYGGYNRFREALSMAVLGVAPQAVWDDPDSYRERPFFELVNFADNEGTIGPEAAADLARDFADFQDRAYDAFGDGLEGASHRGRYHSWRRAFEIAARGGLVEFR